MNQSLNGFFSILFHGIGFLHYIAFAAAFFIFVLFILLLNATKRYKFIRNIFAYLAFALCFTFPFLINWLLDEYLFKLSLENNTFKKLKFVDKIIFKATVRNDSTFVMRNCTIYVIINSRKSNAIEQNLSNLVPQYRFMNLDLNLDPKQSSEIRFSFNETRDLESLHLQPKLRCNFNVELRP